MSINKFAVTKEQILQGFINVGISKGDTVYVASTLTAFGLMENPVESVYWALTEAVGEEGTLIFPAFNYDFCKNAIFNRENTPSTTGVLTEYVRKLPNARRTFSPPYHTVVSIGKDAAKIASIESQSSFGENSIFQYTHDVNAKILLIGVNYHQGGTHFHWIEELCNVPYRFWKEFHGTVILNGEEEPRTFKMYARNEGIVLDFQPMGLEFEHAGYVQMSKAGLCSIRAFHVKDLYSFVKPKLDANPTIFVVNK